jgi:hypothetical protein
MTFLDQSPETYLDRETAMQSLAGALRKGSLVLFLGAGVSKAATSSLPGWDELVKACCAGKSVSFNSARAESNEYLRRVIEDVERKCTNDEFLALVEGALYTMVRYDIEVMKTNLFVALGSLIMNSLRGSAGAVVTYNFDDLLEWYLCYHGFVVEIVSDFPSLSIRSDVRVYHPHGFLPKIERFRKYRSKRLVFSQQKYEAEISSQDHPWNEIQRGLLSCNVGLFVGLSGEDPHISILCEKVYNRIVEKKRLIGFQVLLDDAASREKEGYNLARGIANQYLRSYDELPEFLLEISRRAADL